MANTNKKGSIEVKLSRSRKFTYLQTRLPFKSSVIGAAPFDEAASSYVSRYRRCRQFWANTTDLKRNNTYQPLLNYGGTPKSTQPSCYLPSRKEISVTLHHPTRPPQVQVLEPLVNQMLPPYCLGKGKMILLRQVIVITQYDATPTNQNYPNLSVTLHRRRHRQVQVLESPPYHSLGKGKMVLIRQVITTNPSKAHIPLVMYHLIQLEDF